MTDDEDEDRRHAFENDIDDSTIELDAEGLINKLIESGGLSLDSFATSCDGGSLYENELRSIGTGLKLL